MLAENMKWTREPDEYTISENRIEITTKITAYRSWRFSRFRIWP